MAESGRTKPNSLNSLSRSPLSAEDLEEWKREMIAGTDHSCALIGSAYLDQVLQQAIGVHLRTGLEATVFKNLFDNAQAPLSSFASKILMAYALHHFGSDERDDLDTIRRIRNAFAHSPRPIRFENSLIAAECDKLKNIGKPRLENASASRSAYILRCLDLIVLISEESARVLSKKIERAAEANAKLRDFRAELQDLSNPLNPNYRG